jgi:hypothetical protein
VTTYIVEFGGGDERWVNAGSHEEAAALALDGYDGPLPERLTVFGPDDTEPRVVPTTRAASRP